jgi:ApaG protein
MSAAAAAGGRLTRTLYRALLREARALKQPLRLLDPPTLEQAVRNYGRAAFSTPPAAPALQRAHFPGVDFSQLPGAACFTGAEVAALVRAGFRAAAAPAPAAGGSGDALQHLSALNTLRALAPCHSAAVSEAGAGVRVEVELATLALPTLPLQLLVASERYTFAYRVRVANTGTAPVQILARHWQFFNAHGELLEVPRGSPGVVGHSPRIEPGKCFEYFSGVSLSTPTGTMEGAFQMVAHDGRVSFDGVAARAELRGPAAPGS